MFRERSHETTACTVLFTSGNFGFVRMPMLLLFIHETASRGDEKPIERCGIVSR